MLLPLALALVTAVALVVVLGPLLGVQRAAPERIEFDRSVYRDQLAELERDHARGVIGDAEALSARLEIERRMLAADRAQPATRRQARPIPVLAVVLALVVAGGAGALYLVVGAPAVPDQPFADRAVNQAPAEDDQDVKALAAKVAAKPDDVDGWMDLGRAEATLREWEKSVDAYRHAATLAPARADIGAAYAEVQVLAADGIVTPGAEAQFRKVLAEDPLSGIARYYLALADAQAGRTQQAIAAWQKLAGEVPENAPMRAELKNRIAEAAQAAGIPAPPLAAPAPAAAATGAAGAAPPGPTQDQMASAANMTPEQRQAMIHSMVDQLAAKLQSAPDDLAGWMRLAKAYSVLGERDKAADAYERASKLDPKNVDIPLGEVDALLTGDALEQSLPDRVVALLHRIEALSPQQPEALWYLGLAAAQAHQPDQAAGYWQRLLAALPPDAPERKTVTDALATVKGK